MINIAIIGSGPSGCYIADNLAKKIEDVQIDIFDRLPTPFGLARAGVAPDHQGTKRITRQFERTLSRDDVRFIGNVEIGRDIGYQELKASYDIVVFTIGASQDRKLGIAGEESQGVYGSGQFAGWYNGHPDQEQLISHLNGNNVAIIGNGNVALDLVRILSKSSAALQESDIAMQAEQAITKSDIREIYLLGRRGPAEASFTTMELKEISQLEDCCFVIDAQQIPNSLPDGIDPTRIKIVEKNIELLSEMANVTPASEYKTRIHFMFHRTPTQIIADKEGKVAQLKLKPTAATHESDSDEILDVGTVITAIGYRSKSISGLPFDNAKGIIENNDGHVEEHVFTAGWCKRGPQGVIPANRADAMGVAKQIIAEVEQGKFDKQKPGLTSLRDKLDALTTVSFEAWKQIDQAEVSRAVEGKPREKFTNAQQMLEQIK